MKERKYMPCEWCAQSAGFRVKGRTSGGEVYQRFACDDAKHIAKTERLACLDIGARRVRERLVNPTGFAEDTERVRGPE